MLGLKAHATKPLRTRRRMLTSPSWNLMRCHGGASTPTTPPPARGSVAPLLCSLPAVRKRPGSELTKSACARLLPRRCTPPPRPEVVGRYRMIGHDGKQGDRRLRALLARCPEWNDPVERERLAATLGEGCGTAALLRDHRSSAMRKEHMFRLASHWRYRSDCWSLHNDATDVRGRRSRRSAAFAPTTAAVAMQQQRQAAAAAVIPLFDRTYTTEEVALGQVMDLMLPLSSTAVCAWRGPHSAVQYGRALGAGVRARVVHIAACLLLLTAHAILQMTWRRVRSIEGALEVAQWLEKVCRLRLQALRAWRDRLGEDGLRVPAYTVSAAYSSPESELNALRYIVSHSRASTHTAIDSVRLPDGCLLAQDAAWLHDYDISFTAVIAMLDRAQALIVRERWTAMRTYMYAAEGVIDCMRIFMRNGKEALEQRLDWVTEAAMSQGPAAGDRQQAQAALAPLVERLRLTSDDEFGAHLIGLSTTPPPLGEPLPPFVLAPPPRMQVPRAPARL